MRATIRDFVQIACGTLPLPEPIVEFGSFLVPGQETLADLRPFFPGKQFVGCDMRAGKGVDLQTNLHHLGLKQGSIGTVLCLDTLEHVEFPHQALENIHGLLKPDGVVILSSVMRFPIHEYPSDYWRFTPSGFKSLLQPFSASWVDSGGREESFPETVIAIAFKRQQLSLELFKQQIAVWKSRQNSPLEHWVRALMPPLILHYLARGGKWLLKRIPRE